MPKYIRLHSHHIPVMDWTLCEVYKYTMALECESVGRDIVWCTWIA